MRELFSQKLMSVLFTRFCHAEVLFRVEITIHTISQPSIAPSLTTGEPGSVAKSKLRLQIRELW